MPQPTRKRGLARARMFLKTQMGWLPGVPLSQGDGGVAWLTMPTSSDVQAAQIVVTRTQLQQATLTYSKLTHRFPRALPQVVDEFDAWKMGVPKLLDLLKPTVHEGAPLPPSLLDQGFFSRAAEAFSAETRTQHPKLAHLIDALSWLTALRPSLLQPSLRWLRSNATSLTTLIAHLDGVDRLRVPLLLWELQRRDGESNVAPLLAFFAAPAAYHAPLWGDQDYVEAWQNALKEKSPQACEKAVAKIKRPTSNTAELLSQWVVWLLKQRQGVRRRALDLFATLELDAMLPLRMAWWREADRLMTVRLLTETAVEAHVVWVERLDSEQVAELPMHDVLKHIRFMAEQASAETNLLIVNTLKLLPALRQSKPLRAIFLTYWYIQFSEWMNFLHPWVESWRGLLRPDLLDHTLATWSSAIEAWPRTTWRVPETAFYFWGAAEPWQRALALLPTLFAQLPPLTYEHLRLLNSLCILSSDSDVITSRLTALIAADPADEPFENDQETLQFCGEAAVSAGQFAALFAHLHPKRDDDIDFEALIALSKALQQTGWNELVAALSLSGHFGEIERVAQLHHLLLKIDAPIAPPATPIPATHPTWVAAYPDAFAGYLAALAVLNDNAETVAARVLGKSFPTRAQLSAELTHLAALPPSDKLQKRQASLQKRLKQPHEPTGHQVEKFGRKLQAAIWRAALSRWETDMLAALNATLTQWLQVDTLPEWLHNPPELKALVALMNLAKPWQAVGRQLLQQRSGDPPWDLRDHPANQAFLADLAERGMAIEQWLTPPAARTVTGENGRQVTLRINDDPLAIFQMGSHFNTCLSIGSFNYFSVFANAADINKRVLFAYDDAERVVGRCLIALTDLGGLLTFHPYCHDSKLGFRQLVADFVAQWATQLGTTALPNGQVSALVGPDWYDDGSVDLCRQFTFLDSDSPFRKQLGSVPETTFVGLLEKQFAPLALNEMTLPLVLHLPELSRRPELIRPLLPLLLQSGSMSEQSWVLAMKLAQRAEAHWFVEQVVDAQLTPLLQRQLRQDQWIEGDLLRLLARYRPSRALRLLRASHRDATRYFHGEERAVNRREAYAIAYELLNRPKQAAAMRTTIKK